MSEQSSEQHRSAAEPRLSAISDTVSELSDGQVLLQFDGPVAHVILNRAAKMNAINRLVLAGVRTAVTLLNQQPGVRAIVLRGAGKSFSAGGDLGEVSEITNDAAAFSEFLDYWHASLSVVEKSDLPTIAAVHGFAFAGGFELTQVCDFVVVGDQTVLGDQHANYGLFPAGGSTQRLPRQIPERHAKWMLMSGEGIAADTALSYGLANVVAPETEVVERAQQMAEVLATKSAQASAAIKSAVALGRDRPLWDAIELEREIAVRHMTGSDARIGFEAFRGRSVPVFG
ncbi:enoyl-CoA hydratase/isomerase family protein [Rhodococcus globerulus]|uniref:Enoyl-CoA hydratase/isomerase family protein n=1 Tax=Rhodococcus globerulus TaxID=33008 RepID=A0ABU4C5E4_RHOGO|nr:enoyl-CoA hydratase/isomerase family protein [Rhodococcus globerulus]MDV6271735.1 enoyl-CoA hydratase/isomerase family protein [Rhodococcus globerulus]